MKVSAFEKVVARELIEDYLPYHTYEDGIYFLKDGGVGVIFECTPLPGVSGKVYSGLESALLSVPEGASVQIILIASPDITELIDAWKSNKASNNPLLSDLINSYGDFLEEKSREPISDRFYSPIRDYKLLISMKLGGKKKEYSPLKGLFSIFRSGETAEEKDLKEMLFRLNEAKNRFSSALTGIFLNPRICEPDRLIKLLYPLFHMRRDYRKVPKWDGGDISECLIENDCFVEIYDEHVKIDDVYGKSICVKNYPEEWGLFDSFFYTGNTFVGETIEVPFVLVLNLIKADQSEKGKIKRNAGIVLSQQMPYSLFPRLKMKHEDLSWGMEKIEKGEIPWYINLSLFLFSEDKEKLLRAIGNLKSYFNYLGFRLEEDRYINFAVFLSSLPLSYDLTFHNFLGRGRVGFTFNAVDLAPVFADPGNVNKPEVLLISPRGQLFSFDLFSTVQGGYHGFVVGMTGSGKSVFLQWLSVMYLASGNRVRIIDIGRSYERLCHNFDGTFIEANPDKPISVNPFTAIQDYGQLEEYLEFLINLFLLMGGSKDRRTFDSHEKILRSFLDDAIRTAYEKYGPETNIDAVVDVMKEKSSQDPRVGDWVKSMLPYTSRGTYGRFFNPPSKIDMSSPLVVMENDYVENIPELRDPLLMMFTYFVSKQVYLEKKFGTVCIIDEAHKFIGNPKIDIFVEQAYRRFRKDGASIILGTQGFEDFYGGEQQTTVGRVIVQNSYWKMFLAQTSTSRQALKNANIMPFGDYEWRLMDSVRTEKGQFSEIMLVTENFVVKGRLILNSFLKAMFFTDPQVRKRIQELVDSGLSYRSAVQKLEEEMGL